MSLLSVHTFTLSATSSPLLLLLHWSIRPLGFLFRQRQSPLVSEREPDPRPLSLVRPTFLGEQWERFPSMHRPILTRTHSLPCHGLVFPTVGSRLTDWEQEDENGVKEYFC